MECLFYYSRRVGGLTKIILLWTNVLNNVLYSNMFLPFPIHCTKVFFQTNLHQFSFFGTNLVSVKPYLYEVFASIYFINSLSHTIFIYLSVNCSYACFVQSPIILLITTLFHVTVLLILVPNYLGYLSVHQVFLKNTQDSQTQNLKLYHHNNARNKFITNRMCKVNGHDFSVYIVTRGQQ